MTAPEPANLPPLAHHGAIDYAELERAGLKPDDVLDFSVNSNPFGPSPKVLAALESVPVDRYPDRESLQLRRALAEHLGVQPASIVAGNGTAELIWLTAFCSLRPGKRVLILGPTFGEYDRAARLMGAEVVWEQARLEEHFRPPLEDFERQMKHVEPDVVFICNPNNPTGQWIDVERIAYWAEAAPTTLFVIDEAYLYFVPGAVSCISLRLPNILVLRSMTKDYSLAGLRLGYAVGGKEVINSISQTRIPWSVNGFAQAAGLAALEDEAFYQETWKHLSRVCVDFRERISFTGLTAEPSRTHFFLVRVGQAAEFRAKMLQQRILVRDCSSFGLPAFIRVATRLPEQNAQFIEALNRVGLDL